MPSDLTFSDDLGSCGHLGPAEAARPHARPRTEPAA
ncbi:hypothetical protein FHS38_003664 [Streptomyces netropsis]|uniref:Uncharacterized protein n=1 Tax=Streptomyces netropsis TaxID=55404 RepID=A0A7W7LCE7_STRNE|nr:hypothetical protein [Streptomyces netropsis]